MLAAVENLEGLGRKLKITVPVEEVNKAYDEWIKKITKTAKVDGFRPGKVPASVIESRYKTSLDQEVASELMQSNFDAALKEQELRIAGSPIVTDFELKKGEPFEFTTTFEVYPEFELKDLTGTKITKVVSEITDVDLGAMLDRICKQNADWEQVERKSAEGDRIVIDFEGFIDGEAFEGGTAKDFQLELGSKQMIPGFEEQLMGVEKDQELEIEVMFPEEYPAEQLAGKASKFKIKVHQVLAPAIPELDEKLAEKIGVEGGVEGLKTALRDNMIRELSQNLESMLKEEVLAKLIEQNPIPLPKSLVDIEIEHMHKMVNQQMKTMNQGKEAEDMELPREPYIAEAEKRVKTGLLLGDYIHKNKIELDKDLVRQKIEDIAKAYQKPQEMVDWYYKNKNLLSEIEALVLEEQAVRKLLDSAEVEEKKVASEEVLNPNKQSGSE